MTYVSRYRSVEGSGDLGLRFTHTNSDLNKGVGDGLVVSKLHEFWGHWDTELLGHAGDFVEVWLSAESGGKSVKTLLGVHKTLKLSLWVVLINRGIILSLLLGSLLISFSNGLVHLSLHLGGLLSGFLNSHFFVSKLSVKLEIDWVRWNWQDWLASWEDGLRPSIASVLVEVVSEVCLEFSSDTRVKGVLSSRLNVSHINWLRSDGQKWLATWDDIAWISVITESLMLELNTVVTKGSSELVLKLMSNVGSGNGLDANLEVELF